MVRVQQKARGRTTGTSRTHGLPCAMVLRLIRALLGAPGFLATVIRVNGVRREFNTSVGVSGPHDFAVRRRISHRAQSA